MRYIDKINDSAKQRLTIITEDGKSVDFNLYYAPTQEAWFFDISCAEESFTANGIKLVLSPNLLRQFKNLITFGLAVMSVDGFDPHYIDDFEKGRIQVYTLSTADVLAVEAGLF